MCNCGPDAGGWEEEEEEEPLGVSLLRRQEAQEGSKIL